MTQYASKPVLGVLYSVFDVSQWTCVDALASIDLLH